MQFGTQTTRRGKEDTGVGTTSEPQFPPAEQRTRIMESQRAHCNT